MNDCEIARRTGIPRSTVQAWRRRRYERRTPAIVCPRCWRNAKPIELISEDYSELLGLYLGDGCISNEARTTRLRIFLDARYPNIIRETRELLERGFPANPVGLVKPDGQNMFVVSVYSSHLACLFPQAANGPKHEREIKLETWQQRSIEIAPWQFLRGCIRSDGCLFVNRTGPYEYLSYEFKNRSKDIIRLFTVACDQVRVEYRATDWRGLWSVRINRRRSVERMLAEVGRKS